MPPSTPWRFYLCLGLPPLPTKCIIYKANLSTKDCRQTEREERECERGKKWIIKRERERRKKKKKDATDFLLICEANG